MNGNYQQNRRCGGLAKRYKPTVLHLLLAGEVSAPVMWAFEVPLCTPNDHSMGKAAQS